MTQPISSYVAFDERPTLGKTKLWVVRSIHGAILGEIAWYGRWRQYTFNPFKETTFSWGCLADIGTFCREQSRLQLQRARGVTQDDIERRRLTNVG